MIKGIGTVITLAGLAVGILTAFDHPRMHHQLLPEKISMEKGYSRSILQFLEDAGHVLEEYDKSRATAEIQAVRRVETNDGDIRLEAVSDSRKNGIAAGHTHPTCKSDADVRILNTVH
jgi:gamma-glutamyltranspeptidase